MNNKQFLTYLTGKKIFILSPHFDDAILSTGMLMSDLKDKADITVINVFTQARNAPYTLSAKQFLKKSNYIDALQMYSDRAKDDMTALSMVGAKYINLGLVDSLFRMKEKSSIFGKLFTEIDHLYPTYRWHVLNETAKNDPTQTNLEEKLREILPYDCIVFVPFGVGNHVDHTITRKSAERIGSKVIYYVDFPYNIRLNSLGKHPRGFGMVVYPIDLEIKTKLIKTYSSQINGLFPNGVVPKHHEVFYAKKRENPQKDKQHLTRRKNIHY